MNVRLQHFLNAENLSQSQFADKIGVARASISHIMAGRNKPGFDFILNMAKSFPALNLDWLITGKGKMYKQLEGTLKVNPSNDLTYIEGNIFDDDSIDLPEPNLPLADFHSKLSPASVKTNRNPQPLPESQNVDASVRKEPKKRNIASIVVFFDDSTYQELH